MKNKKKRRNFANKAQNHDGTLIDEPFDSPSSTKDFNQVIFYHTSVVNSMQITNLNNPIRTTIITVTLCERELNIDKSLAKNAQKKQLNKNFS